MNYNNKKTTIQIDNVVREALESYKITSRESLNDVLKRVFIIDNKKYEGVDIESLINTIEALQDPELMKDLRNAMKEVEKGNTVSWEEVKKRNDL